MPQIFNQDGFVIYFYPSEQNERHHLIHVHVYKVRFGGDAMTVTVPELEILESNMSARDERKAMEILSENLGAIMEAINS